MVKTGRKTQIAVEIPVNTKPRTELGSKVTKTKRTTKKMAEKRRLVAKRGQLLRARAKTRLMMGLKASQRPKSRKKLQTHAKSAG